MTVHLVTSSKATRDSLADLLRKCDESQDVRMQDENVMTVEFEGQAAYVWQDLQLVLVRIDSWVKMQSRKEAVKVSFRIGEPA